MAWYYGTFACGHEGRVDIIGPTKDRQWKADSRFSRVCEDCWKKEIALKKEEKRLAANKFAKEFDLPELNGTEKQVEWANTLREKLIGLFEDMSNEHWESLTTKMIGQYDDVAGLSLLEVKEIITYITRNKVDAKYYIEGKSNFVLLISNEIENVFPSVEQAIERDMEQQVKEEVTVYPENKITNAAVEIKCIDDKVEAFFERDKKFIKIVKSLNYRWNGSSWYKLISETTGSSKERAAELGNTLLNAGYPVTILDDEVRINAINGNFEPECSRWIYKIKNKNKLWIKWRGYNDKLYSRAKSLPSAKWNAGMMVDVAHYVEIEEFAELHGFKFTTAAKELIKKHKAQLQQAELVKPAKIKQKETDGLEKILESDDDILADLKD